jgi:hypothetical protein
LLGAHVEIEVTKGSEPANCEPEAGGQPSRGAAIDEENRTGVPQRGGNMISWVFGNLRGVEVDRSNPAPTATERDLIVDSARSRAGMRVDPLLGGRVRFNLEAPTVRHSR